MIGPDTIDEVTSEEGMEEALTLALEVAYEGGASSRTNEEAGLMTRNKGIVVTLDNGAEFQVTIVQSRLAKDDEAGS